MKGRDAGVTIGLGLLLLFGVPIGLAQQPGASNVGKWSKGIASGPSLELWWDVTKGRSDFLALVPPTD